MWIIQSKEDIGAVLREITKQSDRGAAIIAASILEQALEEAIKARFQRDAKVEARLFKGSGPLASFSSKIDLGFLLGIYSQGVRRYLHIIRDIRNEFAHKVEPRTFRSQRINDLCRNLASPGILYRMMSIVHIGGDDADMNVAFRRLALQEARKKDTPRNRYEAMIKFHLLLLRVTAAEEEKKRGEQPYVVIHSLPPRRRKQSASGSAKESHTNPETG